MIPILETIGLGIVIVILFVVLVSMSFMAITLSIETWKEWKRR